MKPSLWLELIVWLYRLRRGGLSVGELPLPVIEALGDLEMEYERRRHDSQLEFLAAAMRVRFVR